MTNVNKLLTTAAVTGLLALLSSCEVNDGATSRTIERESSTSPAPSLGNPPLGTSYHESGTRPTTIAED